MIAFEVSLNGRKVVLAGAEDLGVLNAIVTAVGKLGHLSQGARRKQDSFDVRIGGLTSRIDGQKNEHLNWFKQSLIIGDEIKVKIVEVDSVEPPTDYHEAKEYSEEEIRQDEEKIKNLYERNKEKIEERLREHPDRTEDAIGGSS